MFLVTSIGTDELLPLREDDSDSDSDVDSDIDPDRDEPTKLANFRKSVQAPCCFGWLATESTTNERVQNAPYSLISTIGNGTGAVWLCQHFDWPECHNPGSTHLLELEETALSTCQQPFVDQKLQL